VCADASGSGGLPSKIAYLRRFDLNLLLSLHALLHTRSVTAAGEWLGVTQPAMSTDLRRLRQTFGDELLVRTGREYRLTALAAALVEPLTQTVVDMERTLTRRPRFDPATERREFSMAVSDYLLTLLLQPLATRLVHEAPRVTVHSRALRPDALALVLRGEADLTFGNFPAVEGVRSEVLFTDRWVCAVSADHPDVGECMTLELFARLPHLEWGIGTPLVQSYAEQRYAALGIERQVPLTTESFALLPILLRGTRLVALVQERLARRFPGLKLLTPPLPIPDLIEVMYWAAATDADPGQVWLRQLVRDIARQL
jgi:LysR family transcriptional regulator, nod-box dependent transcriptional activator